MRRITLFLLVLIAAAPAFELLPWEAGQWASYVDEDGKSSLAAALIGSPDDPGDLRLQVDLELPEVGRVVVQLYLVEGGAEFVHGDVAAHVEEPGATDEPFDDFESLLAYYENFGGDILFGVDSPELGGRLVLAATPDFLYMLAESLADLEQLFDPGSGEAMEYQVEDDVGIEVPAGAFTCRKIAADSGTSWCTEEVPLFGIARVTIPDEYGEGDVAFVLTDFGLSGASDALEGWPAPLPLEAFLDYMATGGEYEPYTEDAALANKKPRG